MFVIATGNPFDGVSLVGTFDSEEEADKYANKYLQGDWWVVEIVEKSDVL